MLKRKHYATDTDLSLKAKGLILTVSNQPSDWRCSIARIAALCKDGINSVASGISELESKGYVKCERTRIKGQYTTIYTFYENPIAITARDNTIPHNTTTGNFAPLIDPFTTKNTTG